MTSPSQIAQTPLLVRRRAASFNERSFLDTNKSRCAAVTPIKLKLFFIPNQLTVSFRFRRLEQTPPVQQSIAAPLQSLSCRLSSSHGALPALINQQKTSPLNFIIDDHQSKTYQSMQRPSASAVMLRISAWIS
jgi:hypothetical protein